MKPKRNNRGFSIAEVVVAMVVVTIVSFATLSVILSANLSTDRSLRHQQAQFYAEDAVGCFVLAGSEVEFKSYLAGALGLENVDNIAPDSDITLNDGNILEYSLLNNNKTLTLSIRDSEGKTVAHAEYTKR